MDNEGNVYFADARRHHLFRWSIVKEELRLICDLPISPTALAFDRAGNLLVVTAGGKVYTCKPEGLIEEMQVLSPITGVPSGTRYAIHPGHRWRDEHDFLAVATAPITTYYPAPDGMTIIPQCDDLTRAYSLHTAVPGAPFYVADEFGQKTWTFTVNTDGSLSEPRLFAEEGELDVAVDGNGNVYIAAGNIFVYNKNGKQTGLINVPERPACLVFGGKEHGTLYVTARSSFYKIVK